MPTWSKNKTDSSIVNGGNEYTNGDSITPSQINACFNNSFYAVDVIDNLQVDANTVEYSDGASVEINDIENTNYKKIVFNIPRGQQGLQGIQGKSLFFNSSYNNTYTYYNNDTRIDIVYYNGNSYVPKNETVSGYSPSNEIYWSLFCSKGADGLGGNITANNLSNIETGQTYALKNIAVLNNVLTAELVNVYTKSESDYLINEVKEEFNKKKVECQCKHDYEITGFGEEDCNLVIDDQDVVITKIQGQTRRKSLNIFNINDINKSYATILNSREFYASGDDYELFKTNFKLNTQYTISGYTKNSDSLENHRLVVVYTDGTTDNILTNNTTSYKYNSYTTIENKTVSYISHSYGNTGYGYYKDIMINEGNTALPYEEYDNTLVNSKCDFISTGRNLFSGFKKQKLDIDNGSVTQNNNYISTDLINVLPNANYYLSNIVTYQNNIISFYDKDKNYIDRTGGTNSIQRSFTTLSNCCYIRIGLVNSLTNEQVNTALNTETMLNYGDTKLPYEQYIEDKMQCGLELAICDYHDNINNVTHRQTGVVDLGSLSYNFDSTYGFWYCNFDVKNFYKAVSTNYNISQKPYTEIPNYTISTYWEYLSGVGKLIIKTDGTNGVKPSGMLYYELTNETIEENIVPSGYKVWYKGTQIQETETCPYILTKQYGISLVSQVLNNVEIDRKQQKQIDLKANLSNVNILEEKINFTMNYIEEEKTLTVNGITGSVQSTNGYFYDGTVTILKGLSRNPTLVNINSSSSSYLSYNSTTGKITYRLYADFDNSLVKANINYKYNLYELFKNEYNID